MDQADDDIGHHLRRSGLDIGPKVPSDTGDPSLQAPSFLTNFASLLSLSQRTAPLVLRKSRYLPRALPGWL